MHRQKIGKKGQKNLLYGRTKSRRKGKIIAPLVYEGHTDSDLFHTWLQKCLLPTIKKGTIIVLDNASFHKRKDAEETVEQAGCYLKFQPPYSPDLNPIEHDWFTIKNKIRKTPIAITENNWIERISTGFS